MVGPRKGSFLLPYIFIREIISPLYGNENKFCQKAGGIGMKKQSWLDKPWTWRGYLKFTGIVYALVIPVYVYYLFKLGLLDWDEVKTAAKGKLDSFRGK